MSEMGFVVAMRGTLVLVARSGREPRIRRQIWLVVSRFGSPAEILALACAGPADTAVPRDLEPQVTLIGRRMLAADAQGRPGFVLLERAPGGIALAGRFLRASGRVRLSGRAAQIELVAAGRFASGLRWRLRAIRQPWLGEWLDADHARLTLPSRRSA